MTAGADLIITDARVHTMGAEGVAEAIAVRDGRIARVGDDRSVRRLEDVDTDIIACDDRVVLPGFIDAHTHMESTGRYLVHADLSEATTRAEALERLRTDDDGNGEWILGFGYDESTWEQSGLLTRSDLDAVSADRPVVAFRVDMHTASLNSVALDRLEDRLPTDEVQTEAGEPTGVIVEDAVGVVREETAATLAQTRALITAARDQALAHGITCVHEMVRDSHAPRVYRMLDMAGRLHLRVRLNYWYDHFDAIKELGLVANHGSDRVAVGAIKTFTDGAIGGRTAKLFDTYRDGDGRGQWVVDPDELRAIVDRVDDAGFQLTIHAIGDEAIDETLTALERTSDPGTARHRIEHVELATDEHIDRLAETGIIASVQPNFLQWAGDDGLYDTRLGEERSRSSNRYRTMLDEGVRLAFGSDSMPMDPLYGIHCAVNARDPNQRLSVDEAIRAYTDGSAVAGFDEHRLGTIEAGMCADLVILNASPWENQDAIDEIDVWRTLVDGEIVFPKPA